MTSIMSQSTFDWQGHRGCRGLMPENTIPAFLKAIDLGMQTIELDIVISKDKKVIVSHEPWMSHVICSHPNGQPVLDSEEKELKIYEMTVEEVQSFDCGLRIHPRFPEQEKMAVHKPTLDEAILRIKKYCVKQNVTFPNFNIELKSHSSGYNTYTPEPKAFVDLVIRKIQALNIEESTTLQSFDLNVLEELNKITNRKFKISYLVENAKSYKKNLTNLSFKPDIYSPYHKTVKKGMLKKMHAQGIQVIPWTVNQPKRMAKLIKQGVDGIITDYPNRKVKQ